MGGGFPILTTSPISFILNLEAVKLTTRKVCFLQNVPNPLSTLKSLPEHEKGVKFSMRIIHEYIYIIAILVRRKESALNGGHFLLFKIKIQQ